MKLKILEYNILNGFYEEYLDDKYRLDKKRMEACIKIVNKENPDILIICEADFSTEHKKAIKKFGIMNDYAKIFDYPYFYYAVRSKTGGSAILSKFPIKCENFSLSKISFFRSKILINNKTIILDVYHPHPLLPEGDKASFSRSIIRDRKKPYLIIGDFNSVSPEDKYDKKRLIRGFTKLRSRKEEEPEDVVEEILKAETISTLLNDGLIDTYRAKHKDKKFIYTNPTNLIKKFHETAMRLDYIFCSKDFKILDSGIIKNKTTNMASDHFPIYAVVELK